MTLSDLEWRCETFTDTKHRAFFLPATAELLGEIRASGLSNGKNRMVVCSFCVQMQMNSSSWVASVLAAFSTGNGDWLFELPIASCGLRLHNYTPFMLRSAAVSAHMCATSMSVWRTSWRIHSFWHNGNTSEVFFIVICDISNFNCPPHPTFIVIIICKCS